MGGEDEGETRDLGGEGKREGKGRISKRVGELE